MYFCFFKCTIQFYSDRVIVSMVRTFSDDNKIYSVDLMFAYINIFKPDYTKVKVSTLQHNLEYISWKESGNNVKYSPMDVIDNKKKYSREYQKILGSNLKYPIVIYNDIIIDGLHRLSKAYLTKEKTIKVYQFDTNLMHKFLVDKKGDINKVESMKVYEFIEIFFNRFC